MSHALIIDDNMIVSRAIQDSLQSLGFNSFDRCWNEEQAVSAAGRHRPDLIVIGDEVESGCALNAARRIVDQWPAPVLMVAGDAYRARQRLAQVDAFEGPFLLNEIEEAVELARFQPSTQEPSLLQ